MQGHCLGNTVLGRVQKVTSLKTVMDLSRVRTSFVADLLNHVRSCEHGD